MSHDMDLLDTPLDMRFCRGLSERVAQFNKQADDHKEQQKLNPFSEHGRTSPRPKMDKNDADYGKPIAGSKTDIRGRKAHTHVNKEILELCEIINEHGELEEVGPGEKLVVIRFGELFSIYTYISNKVVGLLLRGRKQKLLDFEGETLFQKRDDDVPIILVKPIEEIRQHFKDAQSAS
ncbi:actin-binding Rho-activating protein [Anabrus simplex]|uniref:actin-binding Rho-activating protein n=1 Tax=Anabrus simplex TaxID=316456 RepID=UPI0035A35B36